MNGNSAVMPPASLVASSQGRGLTSEVALKSLSVHGEAPPPGAITTDSDKSCGRLIAPAPACGDLPPAAEPPPDLAADDEAEGQDERRVLGGRAPRSRRRRLPSPPPGHLRRPTMPCAPGSPFTVIRRRLSRRNRMARRTASATSGSSSAPCRRVTTTSSAGVEVHRPNWLAPCHRAQRLCKNALYSCSLSDNITACG